MLKRNNAMTIECRYFKWRLRQRRNGYWQADSRGNKVEGGRHSLGTKDLDEAKRAVHLLDEQMAAKHGLISYQNLFNRNEYNLTVDTGFAAYQEHIERPRAAGGPKPDSRKRYERIMRAFRSFLEKEKIQYCEQITKKTLNAYASHRGTSCMDSSIKLELLQVRTFLNFLREEKFLAAETHFTYRTKKPKKTKRRYCPKADEARAILRTLQQDPELRWLFHAAMMLLNTGLRFAEIAQMTSHDINLDFGVIWVLDEEEDDSSEKETKSGEDRFLPITPELRPILEQLVTSEDRKLFTGPRGGHLRSDTFNDNLRLKALIPLKDRFPRTKFESLTAHGMRHFFRTHATHCGISKTEIDAWMGHDENSMSQRYFHEDIESACESIKKFKPLLSDQSDDNVFDNHADEENNSDTSHRNVEDGSNINPEDRDLNTVTNNQ